MKTFNLKKSIEFLLGKCNLILTACITLFFFDVNTWVTPASAQSVMFDFDNAPIYTSLPIDQTAGGITAHLSAGYYGYSIQNANVLGFTPPGFAGRCIYPNSVYLTDLYVSFDQTLSDFSIMYCSQELGCDDAETMRVTAYLNGVYVGTNTKVASHPGTWPVDSLKCSFAQGFDSVVVHYDSHPPTCQDYGVIYLADNMRVTAIGGCTPPTAQEATISAGGPTTFCKGSKVVLSVATPGLTYQWKSGNKNVVGATSQNYTVNKSGTYKCFVSNNCGSITSNSISVTVNPQPSVTISKDPCSAGAVLLHANANPNTGVTYQWKKGTKIVSGATGSTYSATQSATYKCIVTIMATGCSKTSAGSSVTINCKLENVANEKPLIVYPNPTSNYFTINTAQLDPRSMIYVYDLTGKLYESYVVNGGEIQVGSSLSCGVYILKIVASNETTQVIKLVKNF